MPVTNKFPARFCIKMQVQELRRLLLGGVEWTDQCQFPFRGCKKVGVLRGKTFRGCVTDKERQVCSE